MSSAAGDPHTRCQARTDRPVLAAQRSQERIVDVSIRVGDRVATDQPHTRPPVAIAFALDRSGSMAARAGTNKTLRGQRGPTAHDLACHALEEALRRLAPHDRVSIALFDDEVALVVDNQPPTAQHVPGWMEAARAAGPRGGSDLGLGWLHSARAAACGAAAGARARVFVLTDGQANVGMTDPQEFVAHASALRDRGVSTSTFGLGASFSETLLAQLAEAGGGAYWYARTPEELEPAFLAELGDALDIVHAQVSLVLQCEDPDVTLQPDPAYPGAWDPEQGAWVTRLPDLVAAQELRLMFPVALPPGPHGSSVRIRIALVENGRIIADDTVSWTRADTAAAQPRDAALARAWASRYADAARLRAAALHQRAEVADARRLLTAAAHEIGQWLPGDAELQEQVHDLLEEAEWLSQSVDPERLKVWHTATVSSLSGVSTDGRTRIGGLEALLRRSSALRRSTRDGHDVADAPDASVATSVGQPNALAALFPRPAAAPLSQPQAMPAATLGVRAPTADDDPSPAAGPGTPPSSPEG